MKPKKTYTRYRVGLFIGLFGFHALSSCVNTGGQLGMGCFESEKEKAYKKKIEQAQKANLLHGQAPPREELSFRYAKDPWYRSKLGILGLGTVGTVFVTAFTGLYLWNMLSGSDPVVTTTDTSISNTTTALTTVESGVASMDNTTGSSIDTTMTTALTSVFTTIGAVGNTLLNGNRSMTTTPAPELTKSTTKQPKNLVAGGEASGRVNNPMVLDDDILHDLSDHGFSKQRIEDWFARGLDVNARTTEKTTLLWYVTLSYPKDLDYLEFLIRDKKADVDAQDIDGNTILMQAVRKDDVKNIRFLTETLRKKTGKSANPLIVNKKNLTAQGYAKRYFNKLKNASSIIKILKKEEQEWREQHNNKIPL